MNDYTYFVQVLISLEFSLKKYLVFSVTSFGTLKYDCVIKTRKNFSFLRLINKLSELSVLLLCIAATISSNTSNTLHSIPGLYSSIFLKTSYILFEYSIRALEPFKCFV